MISHLGGKNPQQQQIQEHLFGALQTLEKHSSSSGEAQKPAKKAAGIELSPVPDFIPPTAALLSPHCTMERH